MEKGEASPRPHTQKRGGAGSTPKTSCYEQSSKDMVEKGSLCWILLVFFDTIMSDISWRSQKQFFSNWLV